MGVLILSQRLHQGMLNYPPILKETVLGRVGYIYRIPIEDANDEIYPDHAKIVPNGDVFIIGPINGETFVNGRKLRGFFSNTVVLKNNDEIELGKSQLIKLKVKIEPGLGSSPYTNFGLLAVQKRFPYIKPIFKGDWMQFDRANKNEFNLNHVDETRAAKEIAQNNLITQKEKLRNYFKIYISINSEYIYQEFDKVLRAINESKVPIISGKVGITHATCLHGKNIVLYVIGEINKNTLINHLLKVSFNPKSVNNKPIPYCKRENPFICWNQGGHKIRNEAESAGTFFNFFTGDNYHLINPEKLK